MLGHQQVRILYLMSTVVGDDLGKQTSGRSHSQIAKHRSDELDRALVSDSEHPCMMNFHDVGHLFCCNSDKTIYM